MLSDKEKEALQQIEESLYQSDQKLAEKLRNPGRAKAQAIILGTLGVILGLTILTLGVIANLIVLGVVGFLVSLISAVAAWHKIAAQVMSQVNSNGSRKAFLETLQNRWEDRKNRDDRDMI